jgi:uncharacterized RDD family membrane protein YckC
MMIMPMLYVAYHTFFLVAWEGQSPGKRLFNIQVTSAVGTGDLSQLRCLARPAIRAALVVAAAISNTFYEESVLVILVLAADVFLVAVLPSRQTLPDLICRTLVVNRPPVQPHRAPAGPMYSASDAEFGIPPRKPK